MEKCLRGDRPATNDVSDVPIEQVKEYGHSTYICRAILEENPFHLVLRGLYIVSLVSCKIYYILCH
jgi:hypothetical protein